MRTLLAIRAALQTTAAPLYSMPHLSFTTTGLPVRSFRKGFGLTGTVCSSRSKSGRGLHHKTDASRRQPAAAGTLTHVRSSSPRPCRLTPLCLLL